MAKRTGTALRKHNRLTAALFRAQEWIENYVQHDPNQPGYVEGSQCELAAIKATLAEGK